MYIGRFYHKLEGKNRVSLPAKFRDKLSGRGVMSRGLDGCIQLFDESSWQQQLSNLQSLSQTKKAAREYIRFLTNDAQEFEIDAQGRIVVSAELKDQAGLTKDVVVVGSYDHIELWDQQRYHTYIEQVRDRIEDQVEDLEI